MCGTAILQEFSATVLYDIRFINMLVMCAFAADDTSEIHLLTVNHKHQL